MNTKALLVSMMLASIANIASAQDMFGYISEMDQGISVDVTIPNLEQNGYVEAYSTSNFSNNVPLGMTPVQAGSNISTSIRLATPVAEDIMVYLFHGEPPQARSAAVDSATIQIEEDN